MLLGAPFLVLGWPPPPLAGPRMPPNAAFMPRRALDVHPAAAPLLNQAASMHRYEALKVLRAQSMAMAGGDLPGADPLPGRRVGRQATKPAPFLDHAPTWRLQFASGPCRKADTAAYAGRTAAHYRCSSCREGRRTLAPSVLLYGETIRSCLAGRLDPEQGKHVLGQIDTEKHNGHGHHLASARLRKRFRNPIVFLALRLHHRAYLGAVAVGGLGDVPFIR